jgi:hypothetical protein
LLKQPSERHCRNAYDRITHGITDSSMRSVTISAKIPASLKRKLERYRVAVSEVVRNALEGEVMRAEEESLAKRLDDLRSRLSDRLSPEDVVSAVKAGRRSR